MQGSSSALPQADLSKIREPVPRRRKQRPLDIDALWEAAPEPLDVDALWEAAPAPVEQEAPGPTMGERFKGAAAGALLGPPGMAAGFASPTHTKAAIGNLARGAAGTVGGMVSGLGIPAQVGAEIRAGWEGQPKPGLNFPVAAGQAISELGDPVFPQAVEQSREAGGVGGFLAGDVAQAGGSAAAFVGLPLGLAGAGVKLGAAGLAALTATQGALVGGSAGYWDAVGNGADPWTAFKSYAGNALVGTSEALPLVGPLERMVNRMPRAVKRRVLDMLVTGLSEGFQEGMQERIGNEFAQHMYDQDRKDWENVARSGGAGALTGVVFGALAGAGAGKPPPKQTGARRPREPEPLDARQPAQGQVVDVGNKQPTSANIPLLPPQSEATDIAAGTRSTALLPQGGQAVQPAPAEAPPPELVAPTAGADAQRMGADGPAEQIPEESQPAAGEAAEAEPKQVDVGKAIAENEARIKEQLSGKPKRRKQPWQMTKAEFEADVKSQREIADTVQKATAELEIGKDKDWKPLELTVPKEQQDGFMYMGRDNANPEIRLYKHGLTRKYLNLDSEGVAYGYREIPGRGGLREYVPIPLGDAIEHAYQGLEGLMGLGGKMATRETPYSAEYRAERDAALEKAGFKTLTASHTGVEASGEAKSHRTIIDEALAQGKPVPPEVLADYPEIAKTKKDIDDGWDEIGRLSGRARTGIDTDLLGAMTRQAGRYIKRGAEAFRSFAKDASSKLPPKAQKLLHKAWVEAGGEFQVKAAPQGDFTLPDEPFVHMLQRRAQNYFNRIDKAQRLAGTVDEDADIALAEEELTSRAKTRVERHRRNFNEKFRDEVLRKHKIKLEELQGEDGYLYALHAPKANELAMERHPDTFDLEENPGSGMSNSEAARLVAQYESDPRAEGFKRARELNRQMVRASRTQRVMGGLLTSDEMDAWVEKFGEDYVPLKDAPADVLDESGVHRHKGLSVRGPESKRREGRTSRAGGLLVNSIVDAEAAIIRGETNRVGNAVGNFVRQNPEAKNAKGEKLMEFAYGEKETTEGVQPVAKPSPPKVKEGEYVFSYKEKGHQVHVILRDERIANALSRMGIEQVNWFFRNLGQIMSFFRQAYTVWHPDFWVNNFQRDLGTAVVNLQEFGKGIGKAVIKQVPSSIRGAYNVMRDPDAKGTWEDHYRHFQDVGGPVGYFNYQSAQQTAKELERSLESKQWLDAFRWLKKFVEDVSGSIEVGVRLATFVELQKRGMTPRRAASVARKLTVDFSRHGELGPEAGAIFLFFNASVQGSARMVKGLKNPRVQKAAAIVAAAGYLSSLLAYLMLGDDDDGRPNGEKVPKHEYYENMNIVVPGTQKRIMWRMPYGYRVFHQLGAALFMLQMSMVKPGEAAGDLGMEALNSFNPIGRAGSFSEFISPTIAKPFAEISTNKTWYGGKVFPDYPNDRRPDSEKKFGSESKLAQLVARSVNAFTGGDTVEPGAISVTPGTLDILGKTYTGGPGQFISRIATMATKAIRGEDIELREVPLVRAVMAEPSPRYEVATFQKTKRQIDDVKSLIDEHRKAGNIERARELVKENGPLLKLWYRAQQIDKRVRELGTLADSLDADSPKKRKVEEEAQRIMRAFNVDARRESK